MASHRSLSAALSPKGKGQPGGACLGRAERGQPLWGACARGLQHLQASGPLVIHGNGWDWFSTSANFQLFCSRGTWKLIISDRSSTV